MDRLSAFFDLVNQDSVVSQVKLIAEPWDVGEGGYQVGRFPPLWTEWNGRYRDTVRDFWRGEPSSLAEFASRFTGSSDLYESDNRRLIASINFVTAHDGFTLADLVSYDDKHNEANGEDNNDGESHNRSWNCGVEGPTDSAEVTTLRERQKRNALATLLLSQGVPMIAHGDELSPARQQQRLLPGRRAELDRLVRRPRARGAHRVHRRARPAARRAPRLRRRRFVQGRPITGSSVDDIAWLRRDGKHMTDHDWTVGMARSVAVFLNGRGIPERDDLGEQIVDDSFLLMINAHHQQMSFTLPDESFGRAWQIVVDTADPLLVNARRRHPAPGGRLRVPARAMLVLRCRY